MPPGVTQVRRSDGTIVTPQQSTSRRNDDKESEMRWDLNNPWATAGGVDPVVGPAEDRRRIDPGPAIGLDR
jgi:hypothetical protein